MTRNDLDKVLVIRLHELSAEYRADGEGHSIKHDRAVDQEEIPNRGRDFDRQNAQKPALQPLKEENVCLHAQLLLVPRHLRTDLLQADIEEVRVLAACQKKAPILREKLLVHLEIGEEMARDQEIGERAEQRELVGDVQREQPRDEAHSLHVPKIGPVDREDFEALLQLAAQRRAHAEQLQGATVQRLPRGYPKVRDRSTPTPRSVCSRPMVTVEFPLGSR